MAIYLVATNYWICAAAPNRMERVMTTTNTFDLELTEAELEETRPSSTRPCMPTFLITASSSAVAVAGRDNCSFDWDVAN